MGMKIAILKKYMEYLYDGCQKNNCPTRTDIMTALGYFVNIYG